MSEQKHTPEPWVVNPHGENSAYHKPTPNSIVTVIESRSHPIYNPERTAVANIARAVACVNGCKGIANPEVAVPEVVKGLRWLMDHIKAGRGGSIGEADTAHIEALLDSLKP